ncbi:Invasin [Yersinia intermedia]|nr:Invasin [Yersinia intermedia]
MNFTADNNASITTVTGTTGADGIATATLTSTTAGTSTVTATVNGHSQTVATTFVAVPAITGVSVNGATFAVGDGFPKTGFTGAEFALNVTGAASDYTWSNGGNAWTTVNSSGLVKFIAKGDSSPVTITATSKWGGETLTYTFAVNSWFISNGSNTKSRSAASTWCTNQGMALPTRLQLSSGTRQAGSDALWSAWGNMGNYSNAGFPINPDHYYWTSETAYTSDMSFLVSLSTAVVASAYNTSPNLFACRQGL